jgi:hypothetical protein
MIEIDQNHDFSKVELYQGILEDAGIETVLRNRSAVTMTTSVPIPSMYPNICGHTPEDATRARKLLAVYAESASSEVAADLECALCGEGNEGNFTECWSCLADCPERGVNDEN